MTLSDDIERLIYLMIEGKPKDNPWKSIQQNYDAGELYLKDIREVKARIDKFQKYKE